MSSRSTRDPVGASAADIPLREWTTGSYTGAKEGASRFAANEEWTAGSRKAAAAKPSADLVSFEHVTNCVRKRLFADATRTIS